MKISEEGKKILIEREGGFKLKAYKDAGGYSIGAGNQTYLNGTKVQKGDQITLAEAQSLFSLKLPEYEAVIKKLVLVPLTQPQYDSLVSLVWNIGAAAFKKTQLLKYINSKQNSSLIGKTYANTILTSQGVLNQGLIKRRLSEAKQFLQGSSNNGNKNNSEIILFIGGAALILYLIYR